MVLGDAAWCGPLGLHRPIPSPDHPAPTSQPKYPRTEAEWIACERRYVAHLMACGVDPIDAERRADDDFHHFRHCTPPQ